MAGASAKRARLLRGTHTDSDSGEDVPSEDGHGDDDATALPPGAAPVSHGGDSLSRLELVRRRLGRTREALAAATRVQWRLLERLREHHRRFVLRHGHVGTKDGAAAVAAARLAAGGGPDVCAAGRGGQQSALAPPVAGATGASGPCTCRPLPLSRFCLRHILLDPAQVLYVADEHGAPRLRTAQDPPPAVTVTVTAAAAPPVPPPGAHVGGDAAPDVDVDVKTEEETHHLPGGMVADEDAQPAVMQAADVMPAGDGARGDDGDGAMAAPPPHVPDAAPAAGAAGGAPASAPEHRAQDTHAVDDVVAPGGGADDDAMDDA